MEEQIQQILRSQHATGQKVPLAHLRHSKPKQMNETIVDEETLNKLQQLKKYNIQDDSLPSDKIYCYYCSLCGRINLVCNSLIETMPRRTTDNALAIDLKSHFLKTHLHRDRVRYIRRSGGIETQFRWKCECGIPIGYTAINYDEFEQISQQSNNISNKPYFYIYEEALVQKMKQSKLISELITYKETILLHLKRKTKK